MTRFLDLLARGATIDSAAARSGVDAAMAEIMADHYERAGVVRLPRAPGCPDCPSVNPAAPKRLGCAGCPFAG